MIDKMVFEDFNPCNMYGRTQLCGLAMPHKIPGSGMLIENEMQKSVEETHGSLQEPDDSYTYQAAGKRSGPQKFQRCYKNLDIKLYCFNNEFEA